VEAVSDAGAGRDSAFSSEASDLRIVDSQVHLWPPASIDRPWPPNTLHYAHGVSCESDAMLAMMAEAGVDHAVLVPPSWEGDRNDYCSSAARSHPQRFHVAGRVPIGKPMRAEEFERFYADAGLDAVRLTFSRGNARLGLARGDADWLWPILEEQDVVAFVYAPDQYELLDGIASRHSRLRMVVDHLGVDIDHKGDSFLERVPGLFELARHEHVAVKASCMPAFALDAYPHTSLHESIRAVVDSFGEHRVFWGSDATRLPGTYRQCVTMFTEELTFLTQPQLRLIMGEALLQWMGWHLDATD
jgi:L-fuconolactonase